MPSSRYFIPFLYPRRIWGALSRIAHEGLLMLVLHGSPHDALMIHAQWECILLTLHLHPQLKDRNGSR
jgi:hypothetical protein